MRILALGLALLLLGGCADDEVSALEQQLAEATAQRDRVQEDLKQIPELDKLLKESEAEREQLRKEWRQLRREKHMTVDR